MAEIDKELLEILVCPVSKRPLVQVGDWLYADDPVGRRRYPIRDGIPVMLIDEAETVSPEEFEQVMARAKRGSAEGTDSPADQKE